MEAPPTIKLNFERYELINKLRSSFLENQPDLKIKNILLTDEYIKKILKPN